MSAPSPTFPPTGAAFGTWVEETMNVILHIGAHRTATKGLHDYMQRNAETLASQGLLFQGPGRRPRAIFGMAVPTCKASTLLVSEPSILGSVRDNLLRGALYPDAGSRVATFARYVGRPLRRIILGIRSLELYWTSAVACGVWHGLPVPDRLALRSMARNRRGWREVITDLAKALPGVEIRVMPFECFAGRPDVFLSQAADIEAVPQPERRWLNRAPELPQLRRALAGQPVALPFGMGRWNPFTAEDHAALSEVHADDMMWLTAGAGGLATLTEDRTRTRAAQMPSPGPKAKGHSHEHTERQVARPG